jgi:hypothetical protein
MSATIHLPTDIFVLSRDENFAFERFAYNVLTAAVPALRAAGLPDNIAVHVDDGEELLDVWIRPQLGKHQAVTGFEVHASVLTPLVLLGVCDRFGRQLFDQTGIRSWSENADAFRARVNEFCGSLGEVVRDYKRGGLEACVRNFLANIEFRTKNLKYTVNCYDLVLKFVANHEVAHAYVGQFTTATKLSVDEGRSFEFIADILATEWLYNTMIRNTRYHGARTPSAWLTLYRLAGDNQLDRSEIGDGYGGKSRRVSAGQQAGRDCRHDRPSPAAAWPISR